MLNDRHDDDEFDDGNNDSLDDEEVAINDSKKHINRQGNVILSAKETKLEPKQRSRTPVCEGNGEPKRNRT